MSTATASSRSSLLRHSLGELLDLQIPPRDALLGAWLVARHQCMLYAPTGLGKSLFAMSAALAVAGKGNVFGWEAPKARRVLIVDGEMDLFDLQERAHVLLPTVEGIDRAAALRNLTIVARHGQNPETEFPDLADAEKGHPALLDLVKQLKPELTILDNFSTLANVQDENEAHSFNPVIELLNKLRAQECATMLVHHSRKAVNAGGSNFRGSSKIAATFESIIELRRWDALAPNETGFELHWDKFRSNPSNRGMPLKAQLLVTEDGASWAAKATEESLLWEVTRAWRSCAFSTQDALAEHLGITKGELSKRKRAAIAAGLISVREWEDCRDAAVEISRESEDERVADFTAKTSGESRA